MKTTFKLVSVKGTQIVTGTLAHAIGVAIAWENEFQPAYGVQIEDANGDTVADIQEGVEMISAYDSQD